MSYLREFLVGPSQASLAQVGKSKSKEHIQKHAYKYKIKIKSKETTT
jgi:hypothetical protein